MSQQIGLKRSLSVIIFFWGGEGDPELALCLRWVEQRDSPPRLAPNASLRVESHGFGACWWAADQRPALARLELVPCCAIPGRQREDVK